MKTTGDAVEDDIGEIKALERLIDSWAKGRSPRHLAEETGKPVGVIYGLLKQRQKAIVEESRVRDDEDENDQ